VQQLVRRQLRAVVDAVAAALVAILLTSLAVWLLDSYAPEAVLRALRLHNGVERVMTITPMVAGLAAFLTGTGTRDESRLVGISWNLLWVVLVISVVAGDATLAGALVSVLLGRAVGLGMRYASGVLSRRAHGQVLVEGIRRAGVDAVSVIRIGDSTDAASLQSESVVAADPIGYAPPTAPQSTGDDGAARLPGDLSSIEGARAGAPPAAAPAAAPQAAPEDGTPDHVQESATVATEREGANRVYAVTDTSGRRW